MENILFILARMVRKSRQAAGLGICTKNNRYMDMIITLAALAAIALLPVRSKAYSFIRVRAVNRFTHKNN